MRWLLVALVACKQTPVVEDKPAPKPSLPRAGGIAATDVSLQRNYGCIREPAGAVKCWGVNQSGEVGDGTELPDTPADNIRHEPTLVRGTVGAGPLHTSSFLTWVVHPDGTVTAWGTLMRDSKVWKHLQPAPWELEPAREVAVTSTFECVIDRAGMLACHGFVDGYAPLPAEQVVAVNGDVCVLHAGEVTCFGTSWGTDLGEIPDHAPTVGGGTAPPHEVGHAHKYDRKQVKLALPAITKLVGGEREICAVDADGAAWCWEELFGPLNPVPKKIAVCSKPLVDLAINGETCGEDRDGHVCCVNQYGAIDTTRLTGATHLQVGGFYVCGIVENELRCAARGGGDETKLYR